jgi:hypothetical protein
MLHTRILEHDRNGRGCRLRRKGGVNTDRGDYCCVTVSWIGRERKQPIVLIFSPAVFDGDVANLDVAEFVQPFLESGHDMNQLGGRPAVEPDHRH